MRDFRSPSLGNMLFLKSSSNLELRDDTALMLRIHQISAFNDSERTADLKVRYPALLRDIKLSGGAGRKSWRCGNTYRTEGMIETRQRLCTSAAMAILCWPRMMDCGGRLYRRTRCATAERLHRMITRAIWKESSPISWVVQTLRSSPGGKRVSAIEMRFQVLIDLGLEVEDQK